jgi:hypothetical protein
MIALLISRLSVIQCCCRTDSSTYQHRVASESSSCRCLPCQLATDMNTLDRCRPTFPSNRALALNLSFTLLILEFKTLSFELFCSLNCTLPRHSPATRRPFSFFSYTNGHTSSSRRENDSLPRRTAHDGQHAGIRARVPQCLDALESSVYSPAGSSRHPLHPPPPAARYLRLPGTVHIADMLVLPFHHLGKPCSRSPCRFSRRSRRHYADMALD